MTQSTNVHLTSHWHVPNRWRQDVRKPLVELARAEPVASARAEAARRVDRWLMDEDSLFTEKNNST